MFKAHQNVQPLQASCTFLLNNYLHRKEEYLLDHYSLYDNSLSVVTPMYFPKKASGEDKINTTPPRKHHLRTTPLQHKERSSPRADTRVQNPSEMFKNNLYKVTSVTAHSVLTAWHYCCVRRETKQMCHFRAVFNHRKASSQGCNYNTNPS